MPMSTAFDTRTDMEDVTCHLNEPMTRAPGHPGIAPTWASSAKDLVGSTLGPSRVWFTLGYGIVNEVYYPRIDIPQIRDLGFIVTTTADFGWKSSGCTITPCGCWRQAPQLPRSCTLISDLRLHCA